MLCARSLPNSPKQPAHSPQDEVALPTAPVMAITWKPGGPTTSSGKPVTQSYASCPVRKIHGPALTAWAYETGVPNSCSTDFKCFSYSRVVGGHPTSLAVLVGLSGYRQGGASTPCWDRPRSAKHLLCLRRNLQSRSYLQHVDGGGSARCRLARERGRRRVRESGARPASTTFEAGSEHPERVLTLSFG